MFRRERPQKGRYRQFYQIGAEVLGRADEVAVDSDIIEMVMGFFKSLGLNRTTLEINSIGDNNCRPRYVEHLRHQLRLVKDQLGADSRRRIETNPLRVLDSKVEGEQHIIENLPHISNFLCDPCRRQFDGLKDELTRRNIVFKENWRLVRGLDYYVRTAFEIKAHGLGSQNAICGGGRYDGLVELLGGHPTPGVGFAIGTDRVLLALKDTSETRMDTYEKVASVSVAMQRPDAVVIGTGTHSWNEAVKLSRQLRSRGLSIYLPKSGTKLARALDAAHRMDSPVAIIVGETEQENNQVTVRVLRSFSEDQPRDLPIKSDDIILYGKIVKLRQDLERALSRLAAGKSELEQQRSISQIVDRLVATYILPANLATSIRNVLPILNRAIHGESLVATSTEWALAYGNLLLNELEKLSPVEAT